MGANVRFENIFLVFWMHSQQLSLEKHETNEKASDVYSPLEYIFCDTAFKPSDIAIAAVFYHMYHIPMCKN